MATLEFGKRIMYVREQDGEPVLVVTPERIESVLFDYYSYIEMAVKTADGEHDGTMYLRDVGPRERDAFKDWLLRNHFLGESVPDDRAEGNIWKPDPDYYPDQEEEK